MEKIKVQLNITPSIYRTRREELIGRLTDGINMKRVGTKYKPITTKEVALRINANTFFTGRPDHLQVLIEHCEEKDSYSKFFFCCPRPKVQYLK